MTSVIHAGNIWFNNCCVMPQGAEVWVELRTSLNRPTLWAEVGHDVTVVQLPVTSLHQQQPASPSSTAHTQMPPTVSRLLHRRHGWVQRPLSPSSGSLQVVQGPELPTVVVYGPNGLVVAVSRRCALLRSSR